MKILCLSDLHLKTQAVIDLIDRNVFAPFLRQIQNVTTETNPDVVVITGDSVVPEQVRLLSALFGKLFSLELPIVLTLGNHEFWGSTFEVTLNKLKEQTVTAPHIHYLDLTGGVELGGVNFVGGTLFFDGSMRWRESQKIAPWDGWQDWRIPDIESRYLDFHRYYIDMIKASMKQGMPTALCTHHVPHQRLNGHEPSPYNFYCGVKNLVQELPFDPMYDNALICGHTHRRVIGEIVPNFMCVNVGSDYGKLEYFLLEM